MSKSNKTVKKDSLTGKKLIDAIVKDIKDAAAAADLEPSSLTISKYYKFGGQFNNWQLRKVGGFNSIKKTFFDVGVEKERASIGEIKELRKQFLRIEKDLENKELWVEKLKEAVASIPEVKVKPFSSLKSKRKPTKRVVNVLLSDLHFGSDLDERETGHKWGKVEEARCFAKVVKNVCSYKTQYRAETRLALSILGDIIENELHGGSSAAPIHEQVCRAIHLLTQGIARFSESFPEVDVYFAVGNHGRDVAVHHGRATAMKWNAIETTIYYAVKTACKNLKNVRFHQPLTPWVVYEACGHKIYATHGDTNFSVGNPGSSVNIKSMESAVNRLNSALKDDEKYAVVAIGHVHLALSTQLPNGTFVIMNGALVPPNSFAQTFGIIRSPQNQVMWESTEDFPVGDQRFINANGAEKDKELDQIIEPFTGIEN
jgi:predicted phosphodiesterase